MFKVTWILGGRVGTEIPDPKLITNTCWKESFLNLNYR